MESIVSNGLGVLFFSVVMFVAGALIGMPVWCWICKKCPFLGSSCCKK